MPGVWAAAENKTGALGFVTCLTPGKRNTAGAKVGLPSVMTDFSCHCDQAVGPGVATILCPMVALLL